LERILAKKPVCVSLFSGCGGLDIGLESAGFSVAVATDIDAHCAEAYRLRAPRTPFITGRIADISSAALLAAANLPPGTQIDLLAGGPPCPAFSKSRFYRKEKPRALDDPIAAETVGGYLRILEELRPRAFLLENVKGLAYGVHSQALETIVSTAEKLGYSVAWQVLNTADFGVPQIRERCIVLGSLDGLVTFPTATHSKEAAGGLKPWVTAGEVLGDLDTPENDGDEGHYAGGQHNDLLREIPPGDNYLYFTEKRGHANPKFVWRSRYWSFLLKLSPAMPSWTIQARRSNNMGPFHWKSRILRISEIKRLQTFPDETPLVGNVDQQWRQVGNAVPPMLGKHLGLALKRHLSERFREAA
jgi:DNA (cytosine-5)-methyltransferase 1